MKHQQSMQSMVVQTMCRCKEDPSVALCQTARPDTFLQDFGVASSPAIPQQLAQQHLAGMPEDRALSAWLGTCFGWPIRECLSFHPFPCCTAFPTAKGSAQGAEGDGKGVPREARGKLWGSSQLRIGSRHCL